MPIEVKFFPEFQHLTSNGKSMVVLDIKSMTLFEADWNTAAVIEEGLRYGSFSAEAIGSAKCLLKMRNISDSEIDSSINKVNELIEAGLLQVESSGVQTAKPRHRAITLDVAQTCQLRCKYCFASGGSFGDKGLPSLMTLEVGRKAVDFFFDIADPEAEKYTILFFGGEPMLNWDLVVELTEYAKQKATLANKKIAFSITTNGINMDEEKAAFLNRNSFGVLVSIDGGKNLHNELRPHKDSAIDSFEATVNAISLLKRGRETIVGRATVTSLCSDPVSIYQQMKELGVEEPNLQRVSASTDSNLIMNQLELRKFAFGMEKLLFENRKFFQRQKYIGRLLKDSSLKGCSFAQSTVGVNSLGQLYACHRLVGNDDYLIGNIYDGFDAEKVQFYADTVNANYLLGCRTCWARYFCGGHCPAERIDATGNPYIPDSRTCYVVKRLVTDAIEDYLIECLEIPLEHQL